MDESHLQKSPAPGVSLALQLCGEDGLKFGEQTFVPDMTKGYFQFEFSHAFPVATVYQTGLMPGVIAKSFGSLLHQNINFEHQLASYHEDRDVRDRVIGSVVAVSFPKEPYGGWQVNLDAGKSPGISGVGVVYKQTQGMAGVLGDHLTGRRKYTVSMEVLYPFMPGDDNENPSRAAGFAVALNGKDPKFDFTPADLLKAGYEYIPAAKAPAELIATFSKKKNRVVAQWNSRKVYVLMGGLSDPVHYAGTGVVQFGAEAPAKIIRMAASGEDPMDTLADSLLKIFVNKP